MNVGAKELDFIRKLALAREAQGDIDGALEKLREGLAAFVQSTESIDPSAAASLITDMWGFCGRNPSKASTSELIEAFDKFCAAGAAANMDPAWLMQFFIMRAQATSNADAATAIAAHRGAIAYFNDAAGLPLTDAISELHIALGDLYFKAERYAEAEQALTEGLALERSRRASS